MRDHRGSRTRKGDIDDRADKLANRPKRATRVARNKGKATLAVRSASAGAQKAATLKEAAMNAHTNPQGAMMAVAHEAVHSSKHFQDLVEQLTDMGIIDTGSTLGNLKRGSYHFKTGLRMNVVNALMGYTLDKALRLGRISTVKRGTTSGTGVVNTLTDFFVPKYDQTLVPEGIRFVSTEADRVIQDGDVYGMSPFATGLVVNFTPTKEQAGATRSSVQPLPGFTTVRAQTMRDAKQLWDFGTCVTVGHIPLPYLDWKAFAKALANVIGSTRGKTLPMILSLFTETAGNFLGIEGADWEMVRSFINPTVTP
jgi:hypothetical protein